MLQPPRPICHLYMHSSEDMREVQDETVQFVLTSPDGGGPYIVNVAREIDRVLKTDGVFLFNMGHIPVGSDTYDILENAHAAKYLPLVPYIVARQILSATSFTLEEDLILVKHYGMKPRRIIVNYEHFFMFTKSDKWKYMAEKQGMFAGFTYSPDTPPKAMPKTFDERLVRDFLIAFTETSDLVLDPFAGTGTLGKIAVETGRNAILYENDPAREPEIRRSIGDALA